MRCNGTYALDRLPTLVQCVVVAQVGTRWRGGANAPSKDGLSRVYVAWLCVLELNGSVVSLDMRPHWFWRGFVADEARFQLRSTDSAELFPVARCMDSRYFSMHGGIGLRSEREHDWFFALTSTTTHSRRAILEVLQDSGFTVNWEEQPFPFDIGRRLW